MSVMRKNYVPVAPFQERFFEMGPCPLPTRNANGRGGGATPVSAATYLADCLGWRRPNGWRDGNRVLRTLGLQLRPQSRGRPSKLQEYMTYEMAVRLCEAMDIDPVDVGL